MHRAHRYLASFFVTAALAAPAVVSASPAHQEDRDRVYDREHKDYHRWDAKEEAAWGRFLEEKHRDRHEFAKSEKKEQEEYWAWRHSHPD